jgi:type I protein arginine methyltransferase
MYDLVDYGGMIAFASRTAAYARALEALIVPGAVVLDMGAGPGIMSLLACRAGAGKVYAVESEDVIQVAVQAAAENGFSNRIEFIQAMTTEIDLPEKVDGIVSDIHGPTPLLGKSIISILDARDRFLKPEAWMIPGRETIWMSLSFSPALYDQFFGGWKTEYQLDFTNIRSKASNLIRSTRAKAEDLLVPPQELTVLDYKSLDGVNVKGATSWTMDRSATTHGLCMWFDCETGAGFSFSNSPQCAEQNAFRHLFLPFPEAIELSAGDRVQVAVRADFVQVDYVWSWQTRVTTADGVTKAEYRQSTFNSLPLSRDRLRKRAHSFVPEPNEDLQIDRRALDLMQQKLALHEIADILVAEFPARFKIRNEALTRAADLSARYSK